MQRYFVNEKFNFNEKDIHHIKNVMRMNLNDEIICISNGEEYLCKIDSLNPLTIKIIKKNEINNELPVKITLIQGLPKKENFELILQKASELGVNTIVPLNTSRTIVKLDESNFDKKSARFKTILKEASEQSRRQEIATLVNPISYKEIKNYLSDLNIIAYEKEVVSAKLPLLLKGKFNSLTILVGPEGGFSKEEVDYAKEIGFETISLGKRILRVETASIYLLSVLGYALEAK